MLSKKVEKELKVLEYLMLFLQTSLDLLMITMICRSRLLKEISLLVIRDIKVEFLDKENKEETPGILHIS